MDNFKLTPSCFREITPKIDVNKNFIKNVDFQKYKTGQPLNKYWTFDFIEIISNYLDFNDIKVIMDIGSRDGYQSIEFRNWFPDSRIIAFEANQEQIPMCVEVTKNHNIEIVPKALGDYNGKTIFNVCSYNVGGSSLLKISNHPRSKSWVQREQEVDIIRLDTWCDENNVDAIDLLWVDVQGAEKMVFDGCGEILKTVKAICTEVELTHMYNGSILKKELDEFLLDNGFIAVQTYHMGDRINSFDDLINNIGECDVIYINKKFLK